MPPQHEAHAASIERGALHRDRGQPLVGMHDPLRRVVACRMPGAEGAQHQVVALGGAERRAGPSRSSKPPMASATSRRQEEVELDHAGPDIGQVDRTGIPAPAAGLARPPARRRDRSGSPGGGRRRKRRAPAPAGRAGRCSRRRESRRGRRARGRGPGCARGWHAPAWCVPSAAPAGPARPPSSAPGGRRRSGRPRSLRDQHAPARPGSRTTRPARARGRALRRSGSPSCRLARREQSLDMRPEAFATPRGREAQRIARQAAESIAATVPRSAPRPRRSRRRSARRRGCRYPAGRCRRDPPRP